MEKNRNQQILSAIRQITHYIDSYSRRIRSEHQVTVPQLVCIHCIAERGPITATAISREIHVSNSTLVGILDRLEKKALIKRQRDVKDRRKVNITATAKGKKLIKNAPSPLQDHLSDALEELPELELAAIALSLERVVQLMGAGQLDAAPILSVGNLSEE